MTIDAIYLLQLTLNGIALGLLYALIAVGLSLIFGVMEIINFAHGELLMLGAFAMCFALPVMGLLYWPAMATAIVATMLVGFVIYEVLLVRLKPDEFERSILITLGLSIIIIHVMQYLFTATPRMVDSQYGFDGVEIGAIRITWTRVIGAGAAVAAFAGLYGVLRFTQFGRAMRAIAQNRDAALMVGIRPRVVARNAVILAAGLCGLAGAAISPIQLVTPYMGQFLIFKAFALVIIGGLFVLEAVSVVIQVFWFKRYGKRIFKMAPIHHHFEHMGWSEPTVVIRFWIVSFILALAGLATLKLR